MEERERRIARNEALYRQVNERIQGLNQAFGSLTGDFAVVCECGDLACSDQIRVPPDAYGETRAHAAQFIVKPGHEEPDVETVVAREVDYLIVRKRPGLGRAIAEATDALS